MKKIEEEEDLAEDQEIHNPRCARCGEPVDLEDLHQDSRPIPADRRWYAVHGPSDTCFEDGVEGSEKAWIVEF